MNEKTLLTGRWATVRIELRVAEGATLNGTAQEKLAQSQATQKRVEGQIARRELAMVHAFYADGTYDYVLFYRDPRRSYPEYHEVGTWAYNAESKRISCQATNQSQSSLPSATVMQVTAKELVVEMRFDGASAGIVETIYHRRLREL